MTGVKKVRKRYRTYEQRQAANTRERRRMWDIYTAFEKLRESIPLHNHGRKLSRLELLKYATNYIKELEMFLNYKY